MNDKAKQYFNYGWSLLPVKPEDKRPYTQNWLQYTKKRADWPMVENWFMHLSNAGIGVVTGSISSIVVIDVESYCPQKIEDILAKYPTDLISRTGSGGYHLFYQYPPNRTKISNRVRLMEGIDLRADGGFIVLPPTIHPKTGARYEWVKEGQMGRFPLEILDIESQAISQDKWLSETLKGVTEGGRNDSAARLAGYFYKKGISDDIIELLLVEWNEKNDPPLPRSELKTVMRSIKRNHAESHSPVMAVEFEDDREVDNFKTPFFDLIKVNDYIKGYGGTGVNWAVQDWLPEKSIVFMVSPPESYKTWLLLDLVTSIASGSDFLGRYKVHNKGPCLVIQQEDSHIGLSERISLIMNTRLSDPTFLGQNDAESTIPLIPDLPIYIHPSRKLRFDNKKVLEELEKQIAEIRPIVVVIDPLYSTASTDNYMAQSAEQMMILKTWRDKYGCSFVIAHHSKKNVDPESTAREDSWGSQFLNAFQEGGWQVRRNPKLGPNEIVVRRHSKTMGNQAPISLNFDISTVYPMKYEIEVRDYDNVSGTPAQTGLIDLIKLGPISQQDIASQMGKSKSTISRQIKQLEMSGGIEKMPNGKYKIKEVE